MRPLYQNLAALLAYYLTLEYCAGLEVDCPACNFCKGKKDLAGELTARIRGHIIAGKSAQEIAKLESGGSILRTTIETWADEHPESASPDRRLVKYRGSSLPDNVLFSAYAHCIKVNGVC